MQSLGGRERLPEIYRVVCHGRLHARRNPAAGSKRGTLLPRSGVLVCYALCSNCGFCFAPQICAWPAETFERWIYNDSYAEVDPDYLGARPRNNADVLGNLFPQTPVARHLDDGGGNGMLANILRGRGWDSSSYDPFLERDQANESRGQFDLITAFEVFRARTGRQRADTRPRPAADTDRHRLVLDPGQRRRGAA